MRRMRNHPGGRLSQKSGGEVMDSETIVNVVSIVSMTIMIIAIHWINR